MPDGRDKLKKLHDNLVKQGYDLPDYVTFERDMTDSNNLRKLHTNLIKDGYDIPEFSIFTEDMGYGVKKKDIGSLLGGGISQSGGAIGASAIPSTESDKKQQIIDYLSSTKQPIEQRKMNGLEAQQMLSVWDKIPHKEGKQDVTALTQGGKVEGSIDNNKVNEIAKVELKRKSDEYEDLVTPLRKLRDGSGIAMYRDEAGVNPPVEKSIQKLDEDAKFFYQGVIYDEALKWYAKKNPQFQKELEATNIDLSQPGASDKIPNGKRGHIVAEFLNQPNMSAFIQSERPDLFPAFESVSRKLVSENKDYGANVVANEVSRAIQESGYNNIDPIFNYWGKTSKEYADLIAKGLYAYGDGKDPDKMKIWDEVIKNNQEKYLDAPSFFEGFASTIKNSGKGFISTFSTPFKKQSDIIKENWEKEASNVSADPKGLSKAIRDIGSGTGFVASIAAPGGILKGVGLTPKAASALSTGTMIFGQNLEDGFAKYPNNPIKAYTSAAFNTTLMSALSYDLFPAEKAMAAFKTVKPEIYKVVENLTAGNITREAARAEMNTIAKNAIQTLKGALKINTKASTEMAALTSLNKGLDRVLMDNDTYGQFHSADEEVETFKHLFLSNSLVSALGGYGEMKNRNKIFEESIYNAANNPIQFKREIEKAKIKSPELNDKEIVENIDFLQKVKTSLDGTTMSEGNKKIYLAEALKSKVAKDKMTSSPEETMLRKNEEQFKRSEEIKESLINGEDIAKDESIDQDGDLMDSENEISPEEIIKQQATEGKLAGGYSELVNGDPSMAKEVLKDYAKQKYGVTETGEDLDGGGREITNKEVDAAVTKAFPTKEKLIAEIKGEDVVEQQPSVSVVGEQNNPALRDVESTAKNRVAKPISKRVSVEHAGHEAAKRVTGANENTLEIDGYGTILTSQFINKLVENGRLPEKALKNRHIQLTEEYATKLLNENSDLFPKEAQNDKVVSIPREQMSDNDLQQIVGRDVFKQIQRSEEQLGEGVVDRNRMIETAKKIQKADKKDKLLPEHIFEALQYETGFPDNWQDLRNAIKKGGIDINSEAIQRQIEVGVKLPKDIVEDFKKSERYKNANPELVKAVEQSQSKQESGGKAPVTKPEGKSDVVPPTEQQSGKDGKVAPDAELGIQQGYAKKAMTDFINSPDMGYSIHEEGGKTALGLSEAQVRSANGLKGGDRMQSHEHTNIELTKDEKKQLNKIESDKELGDIDGLEYAKQKRALAKKIFERASNELQQKANEQSGKDVVVDEGVVDNSLKDVETVAKKHFSDEAILSAKEAENNNEGVLINMPIDDFLSLNPKGDNADKRATVSKLVKEGTKFNEIPFLNFTHDGNGNAEVTGHEGRHRAMELKAQGETTIPVLLRNRAGGQGEVNINKESISDTKNFNEDLNPNAEKFPTKLRGHLEQKNVVIDFPLKEQSLSKQESGGKAPVTKPEGKSDVVVDEGVVDNGLSEGANKILGLHDNGVNFDLFDNNKLREIAKENGIDLPEGAKNADIIEALKNKRNELANKKNETQDVNESIGTEDNTETILATAEKKGGIYAQLAKAVKNLLGGVKTTVYKNLSDFAKHIEEEVSTHGAYDESNKTIHINNATDKNKLHIFFHEALHHITIAKIKEFEKNPNSKNLTPSEFEAILNLKRIYKQISEKVNRDRGGFGKQSIENSPTNLWMLGDRGTDRGFANVHEFISEAFTNPEFQKILKDFKGEGKSPTLFKQFLDAVAKLLGLKDPTILDDIFHHTEKLIDKKAEQKSPDSVGEGKNLALGDVESTAKALEGVNNVSNVKKLIPKIEKGQHQIIKDENSLTLDDLTKGSAPSDIYTGMKYYADLREKTYQESARVINQVKGKPDAIVTIYRSVPKGVSEINSGDWVSLSKTYAKEHGMHHEDSKLDMPVISMKVKASEVVWDANDLNEFAYFPEKIKSENQKISEAYHKAKSDGSNPELVKAVEELISQKSKTLPTEQKQTNETPISKADTEDKQSQQSSKKESPTSKQSIENIPPAEPPKEPVEGDVVGDGNDKPSGIRKKLVSDEIIQGVNLDRVGDKEMMALGRKILDSGEVKPAALVQKIITEKSGVLRPAEVVGLITYKADIDNALSKAYKDFNAKKEAGEDTGTLGVEIKDLERQIDDFDVMAIITANQQSMAFRLRQYMLDRNYNVVDRIEKYKKANNGYISPEVEAKFRELDKQLKEVNEKLKEAQQKLEDKEAQQSVDNIKESVDREQSFTDEEIDKKIQEGVDKEISKIYESLPTEKKSAADKAIAALEKFRTKLKGRTYDATLGIPVFIADKGALVAIKAIKLGRTVAEAVKIGIKSVKDALKEKGITEWEEQGEYEKLLRETLEENGVSTKKPPKETPTINEDGTVSIPNEMLRNLVKRGVTDINDLTDAVHEKVSEDLPDITHRQVRDAITDYGKKVNPTADEIQQQVNTAKRIGRLLSEVEDLKRGVAKAINPKTKAKLTEKERELNRQIRSLEKNIGIEKKSLTDEEKISLAKERVKSRIEELNRKIKNKDFSKKKKLEPPKDDELVNLESQKEKLQEEFDNEQYKVDLKNRTAWKKAEDIALELTSGLVRGLVASVDLSAGLVQGTYRLFTDLGKSGYELVTFRKLRPNRSLHAFGTMFKHLVSQKASDDYLAKVKSSPAYPLLKASKLAIDDKSGHVSAKEGLFISNWVNFLWNHVAAPIVTVPTTIFTRGDIKKAYDISKAINPYLASQRAFDGYINSIRVNSFKDFAKNLDDQGYTYEADPKVFEKAADVINTTTGRGGLGTADASSRWLNIFLFAPRKVISEVKLFTPWAFKHYAQMPPPVRRKALKDLGIFLSSFVTANALTWLATKPDDDDEEGMKIWKDFWNLNSSNFLTHKIGDKRISLGGGAKSMIVFQSRLITGEFTDQYGNTTKLGERYGKTIDSRLDLIWRFILGKGSPAVSVIAKKADEKKGREVDDVEIVRDLTIPIWMQDLKTMYKTDPGTVNAILTAFSIFGANVRAVDSKPKSQGGIMTIKDPDTFKIREATTDEIERYKTKTEEKYQELLQGYTKFDEIVYVDVNGEIHLSKEGGNISDKEKRTWEEINYLKLDKKQKEDADKAIKEVAKTEAKKVIFGDGAAQ